MNPAASVFHYATAVFEGMKAFRGPGGKPTLFRPEMNMDRFEKSAERIALPVSRSSGYWWYCKAHANFLPRFSHSTRMRCWR